MKAVSVSEPSLSRKAWEIIILFFAVLLLAISAIEGAGQGSSTSETLIAEASSSAEAEPAEAASQNPQTVITQAALTEEPTPGVTVGFGYCAESVALVSGQAVNRNLHYLDNVDLTFEVSTEGLGLWRGGTLMTYLLSNNGADPTSFVGDMQCTSNIEANDTQRLYEFWYNQSLFKGKAEILLGLHDLNSEYYTSEPAGFFNNGSFGIGADVAGNAPVGIFNVAAVTARIRIAPTEQFAFQASVYDGDPGDPDANHNGVNVDWDPDQGFMTIYEAQYSPASLAFDNATPQVYRLGGWYHTAEFERIGTDTVETVRGNYGLYFSVDQPLSESLNSFIHGGFAAGDRSPVPAYIGLGFQTVPGARWFLLKNLDQTFGLAVNSAFIQEANANEMVIEAAWQIQLSEFLSIKPDLQYVVNPGGDTAAENALVFSIRTEVGL
jgi:porin